MNWSYIFIHYVLRILPQKWGWFLCIDAVDAVDVVDAVGAVDAVDTV